VLIELTEVGKKVSKARLDKLKAAFATLKDILGEVEDEEKADEKAESLLPALFEEASAVVKKGEKFVLFEDGVKVNEFDDEDAATKALKKLRAKNDKDDAKEESYELDTDVIQPLVLMEEKAVRADGTTDILIASEGWGSYGYYPREVLERDGPAVWPKGTHMYWDHPTETEKRDRPERSLKDLAAVTESDPVWKDSGPAGPGLYATSKVRTEFQPAVNELAPHIGVSLRAFGSTKFGEKEGRKGPIIEKLVPTPHNSIDFVTLPGRGGKVVQLFESAREGKSGEGHPTEDNMKDIQELRESHARLQEALVLRDARDFVSESLRSVKLPDITKGRLAKTLAENPPTKDGKLDTEAFGSAITEAVKAEANYLAEVAGLGTPRDFGLSGSAGDNPPKIEDVEKELEESFRSTWGLSEKQAKQAVIGRGN